MTKPKRMTTHIIPLFIALVAITIGSPPLSTQSGLPVPPSLLDQVAALGQARVIVGVSAGFVPEGFLRDGAAVADQHVNIQLALDDVAARAASVGAAVERRFERIPFFVATVDAAALAALRTMPGVGSIEPERIDRLALADSVPLVNAPAVWNAGTTGQGWTVAVLDSGIDLSHPFLSGKIVPGAEACYSSATDPNGGTTSSLCPGGAASSTAPGSGAACTGVSGCGHGTHAAGIAVGTNGSAAAPSGVAPGARLVSIQVFTRFDNPATCVPMAAPCLGASTVDQIDALNRVLTLAGAGNANRIAAVNLSLSGDLFTSSCDAANTARKAAIDNLRSIGIPTIIATGNNFSQTGVGAPACISTAVAVSSTSKTDTMPPYANRAPSLVALVAPGGGGSPIPGTNIASSVPGGGFAEMWGTSMAAPHVAGAWALLKQLVPSAGVSQVLAALQNTGAVIDDTSASGGSYRRIDINAARIGFLGPLPGTPGAPVATGAGNRVRLDWSAPTTGGVPTSFTVIARSSEGGPVITTLPVGNQHGVTVNAPNGSYFVTVRASNQSGAGPESAGITVQVPIVITPPGMPTNLAATVTGSAVGFTWTPPATGGQVTGYVIVASYTPGGAPIATLPFAAPASTAQVTRVPPGDYYVRLVATNTGVPGPPSDEVHVHVAAPQPPSAPTLEEAFISGNTVGLSWTPGATGDPASDYIITASYTPAGPAIASFRIAAPMTTALFNSVPPNVYYVRVRAVNGAGPSATSNEITVSVP